jgi:hypothetical protein
MARFAVNSLASGAVSCKVYEHILYTQDANTMPAASIIFYARVSTARQGRSGLGLEAQREAMARFAAAEGFEVAAEYTEVETGKGSDALERRPQLAAALADAKRNKCPIIVAKLDRLSRDVHFISGFDGAEGAVRGRRAWQ